MTNSPSFPWKHSWKHSITDRHGDPSFDIEVVSYKTVIDELVEDFACYLMGCGYSHSLIIEAFSAQADEFSSVTENADEQTLSA